MKILILFLYSFLKYILAISHNSTNRYNASVLIAPKRELSEAENDVWCKFQPNGYDCKENGRSSQRYYYDLKLEDCKLFNFGSCKHEQNHFKTLKECQTSCLDSGRNSLFGRVSARIYCKFQPDFGNCYDYHPKYYYDMTTRTCRGFSYSGCGGNLNRFSTMQLCSTTCAGLNDEVQSKELT